MCLLTLTLKFSTRTPKVPFGPLGGASGIALFTARAPGGPRAPFFFSRGGSGAAPGGLGGASGAPLERPGGVPGHLPATSGTLRGSLGGSSGTSGVSGGRPGPLAGPPGAPLERFRGPAALHGISSAGVKQAGFSILGRISLLCPYMRGRDIWV